MENPSVHTNTSSERFATAYPLRLADLVDTHLERASPGQQVLQQLFEQMYFASMQTEEYLHPRFNVVLSANGDIPSPWWELVEFDERLPFDASALVHLAHATDPGTSAIVARVDKGGGELGIIGLLHRSGHLLRLMPSKPTPPHAGSFEVRVSSPAFLDVFEGPRRIAGLRPTGEVITGDQVDVLGTGVVHEKLTIEHAAFLDDLQRSLPFTLPEEVRAISDRSWGQLFLGLLQRMRNLGHGGALIVGPQQPRGVVLRYPFTRPYDGLRRALHDALRRDAAIQLSGWYEPGPTASLVPDSVEPFHDYWSDVDDALSFVAQLTRVDGAVVMDPGLGVHGFGAMIEDIPRVSAHSATGSKPVAANAKRFDQPVGARHQSMMAHCHRYDDLTGFVASQDGPVTAMTSVDGHLYIWSDILTRTVPLG